MKVSFDSLMEGQWNFAVDKKHTSPLIPAS
jgi:hypothetical protein